MRGFNGIVEEVFAVTMWLERADGFFFPRSEISATVESKLQTLALDDAAQNSAEGTLLPFDKSVLLSDEDAELLNLPPRNPYQISIRTEGYIGAKNFRYVAEFLDANGRPLTKLEFNGAVLRVGDEKIFRLNADQFAPVNLIRFGNENIQREEPLLTIRQIQRQAHAATAHVDKYIADFERVDYQTEQTFRDGKFFADVLCPDVKLLPHQESDVTWIFQRWQAGCRGVLVADDMGPGKTLLSLTFIGGLKKFDGLNSPVLVVAPTALLATWQAEYRKFLLGNIFDDVLQLHGLGLKNFLTDELTPNGKHKLSLRNLPPNVLALTIYETLHDCQFSFAGDAENIRRLGTEFHNRSEPLILLRMKENRLKNLSVKNIFTCREEMPTYQRKIYSAVPERYRRRRYGRRVRANRR